MNLSLSDMLLLCRHYSAAETVWEDFKPAHTVSAPAQPHPAAAATHPVLLLKTKTSFSIIIASFILSLLSQNAFSLDTVLETRLVDGSLVLSASLSGENRKELGDALGQGLKSEIIFQIRIYKKNRGLFSFTGDTLLLEKKIGYIAYMDFFKKQFVIRMENVIRAFDDEQEFFYSFTRLDGFRFELPEQRTAGGNTVLVRITLNPVMIEPPLHIVSLITPIGMTTGWAERSF